MHIERRNPPEGNDTAGTRELPARREMGGPKKNSVSEKDLDADPIVAELRKLYEGVVDEPLPDDLLELLRRLDEAERNR